MHGSTAWMSVSKVVRSYNPPLDSFVLVQCCRQQRVPTARPTHPQYHLNFILRSAKLSLWESIFIFFGIGWNKSFLLAIAFYAPLFSLCDELAIL